MKTKLSGKFWLALTLFSLIGQVAWVVENMYLNVFIYKMFNASAADISNMVAASAVSATLTTVLIGALSDKIGKRKLFICGGYILWGISIFSFVFLKTEVINSVFPLVTSAASMGATLTIILDCIMTFFGSTANDAAFNAWVTDCTDSTNRGAAEGINSMMPLVSILVVFGGFMFFDLDKPSSWTVIFTIIGCVVTFIGILGCFIIKDKNISPSESGYFKNVIYGFLPKTVRMNITLYITLLCFIIFNISIQIFMPYLIIYYEVSLGLSNYVFIMAPAIIIAAAVTAFWGKIYDKKGFGFSSFIGLFWLIVGYILLYLFKSTIAVFIGSLFMMCGYLSSMAVFGAKIRDLTPIGKSGRFQGIRIFSQVLVPGIIGPFIGKTVLKNAEVIINNDGTQSFIPNRNIFLSALITVLILFVIMLFTNKKEKPKLISLKTPFEEESDISWETEHPSPQLKRTTYINLCGEWNLSVEKGSEISPLGTILVPYPPESRISGIERQLKRNERYIYCKEFSIPDEYKNKNIILHFGAVDQIAEVFLNGKFIGKNIGGYLPFKFNISDELINGINQLKVVVTDKLDKSLPYGKQRKKRGGMWYTPISGIWQPVWLEVVPEKYIEEIKITPSLYSVTIETVGGEDNKTLILENGEQFNFTGNSITININSPINWTPENPHLYYFTLKSGEDVVESYFALRSISVKKINGKAFIALNDKPYFFHGLLDQGYFSDGIYTPYSPEGYLYDVLNIKKMGFNMLRKHIKTEPEIFYYYCDKYGVAVFQDMVNNGNYNFIFDTALPTVGIKKWLVRPASKKRRKIFEDSAFKTLKALYNHPSICYYTVFNEGWGQYRDNGLYSKLKTIDNSRIYDMASGWFKTNITDVISEHIYFKKLKCDKIANKPIILSEFGGYSCKIKNHSFNLDKTYGYRYFDNTDDFSKALEALYRNEVIPLISKGLSAAVLTQVSDVEDETNGIFTYDRKIIKTNQSDMQNIASDIIKEFNLVTQERGI